MCLAEGRVIMMKGVALVGAALAFLVPPGAHGGRMDIRIHDGVPPGRKIDKSSSSVRLFHSLVLLLLRGRHVVVCMLSDALAPCITATTK